MWQSISVFFFFFFFFCTAFSFLFFTPLCFDWKWRTICGICRTRTTRQSSFCGQQCTLKLSVVSEMSAVWFSLSFIGYYILCWLFEFLVFKKIARLSSHKNHAGTTKVFLFKLERVSSGLQCTLICLKTLEINEIFLQFAVFLPFDLAKRKDIQDSAFICAMYQTSLITASWQ